MKIRTKITLTFFFIVIVILSVVSIAIYFFSANYRQSEFHRRLKNRASNTANVLSEFKELEPELFKRMEKENPANLPNQYIAIYGADNRALYSSEEEDIVSVDPFFLANVRQRGEIRFEAAGREALGFVFKTDGEELIVVAAANDVYGFNGLDNLRNILIAVFAVSAILVSLAGWFYAERILRPVSKIVSDVDAITEASLNLRLDEGDRSDELNKLAQTFNNMLSRLEGAFLTQKNFIANASHELRTPITVIIAEIEATLLKADPANPHTEVLRSLLETARSLNSLTSQLLLLAQTSAIQPEKGFVNNRVDEILWGVKQDLERVHADYGIDIHFALTLNDEALSVKGDEQLLKILFTNLIDNGCKYSFDHKVSVTIRLEGVHIVMDFRNSGAGIRKEDLAKIFNPFYRGASTKQIKGFGIGLSLASSIIRLHRGSINVRSLPDVETVFTITLPAGQSDHER